METREQLLRLLETSNHAGRMAHMVDVGRRAPRDPHVAAVLREMERGGTYERRLAAQAQPGPVDGHGWTVLAGNAAVAAKLRQLVPLLAAELERAGHASLPIRIKVQPMEHGGR